MIYSTLNYYCVYYLKIWNYEDIWCLIYTWFWTNHGPNLFFSWISKCVSFRLGLWNIIGTHREACVKRRGNYKKYIYLYKTTFLIVHVEYVKLCLTWAVNKQFYESFTNMWYSIPDINCLFETLNENSGLFIRKFQIFVVN